MGFSAAALLALAIAVIRQLAMLTCAVRPATSLAERPPSRVGFLFFA
jgi:hypothetical protein